MNHLTEEQFEDILQGETRVPDHVEQCPQCRALLAEKRALGERLRKTFSSVRSGSDLADRIRAQVGSAATGSRPRTLFLAVHRRLWSSLAAAAAILVVAIPVGLYINTTSRVEAAQTQLVEIHKENIESLDGLFVHEDPSRLTGYLENETGHAPATLCTGSGLTLCGCCTRQFQGRTVGSYVVQSQNGPISIVITPDSPKSLGMTPGKGQQPSKRPIWRARCNGCNMASVSIGNRSYYAVGQVAQEDLDGVLSHLIE